MRMLSLLVLLVVCSCALANETSYSFSTSVGSGIGTSFSLDGGDRITAVRLYEVNNAYIAGIQIRFGAIWSARIGRKYGKELELELYDDEHIRQISGKFNAGNYIYQLIFHTSAGRSLMAGQPLQNSFNMYGREGQQLVLLSGRFNSAGITAIAAHWGIPNMDNGNSTSTQ